MKRLTNQIKRDSSDLNLRKLRRKFSATLSKDRRTNRSQVSYETVKKNYKDDV